MEGVLEVLSPALEKDPISALMEWGAAQGCRKVVIKYVFVNAFWLSAHLYTEKGKREIRTKKASLLSSMIRP